MDTSWQTSNQPEPGSLIKLSDPSMREPRGLFHIQIFCPNSLKKRASDEVKSKEQMQKIVRRGLWPLGMQTELSWLLLAEKSRYHCSKAGGQNHNTSFNN